MMTGQWLVPRIGTFLGGHINESAKMRTISSVLPCAGEQYALSTVDGGSDPPMLKHVDWTETLVGQCDLCVTRYPLASRR